MNAAANSETPSARGSIRLRGVRVNNLKNIDLDIPHGQLLCLCGLSGSGKTSLALDTLFAEGQRRYIECFSPYTRQFLEQWDKPDADRIDGIPPAIAVTASRRAGTSRTTVGSVTEAVEFLRLLFARVATLVCPDCQRPVRQQSPQAIAAELARRPAGWRFQVTFPVVRESPEELKSRIAGLSRQGFRRVIFESRVHDIDDLNPDLFFKTGAREILVIVDRLKTGSDQLNRTTESLETAYHFGSGSAVVLVESDQPDTRMIDGRRYDVLNCSASMICSGCGTRHALPEPGLFSFNSTRGACSRCEGFGSIHHLDIRKIVPDAGKTIREGAIAPWNSPAYRHELEELIAIAAAHEFPLDIPFEQLQPGHLQLLWEGDQTRDFGGLNGFFRWLEKRKYKMHLRVFLARWRSYVTCPECEGRRLNPLALAWHVDGSNIAEFSGQSIDGLLKRLSTGLSLDPGQQAIVGDLIQQLADRLGYLTDVGVGYLSLDRPLRTLGGGERQRVALTRALGSTLVNLLYVLDEPTAGLHPRDVQRLIPQIRKLQSRRNTVVMVEHHPAVIGMAERVVEIGPGAGVRGGEIVFDGSPGQLVHDVASVTGEFLAGHRGYLVPHQRRTATRGSLRLQGAAGHNLQNIDVEFPLGMLCLVTGVSGSGKSSLVRQTLAPALQQALGSGSESALPHAGLRGSGLVDEVAVIDQRALAKMSRSNPATYVKAFDEIRRVFAATPDARALGLKPGHFSFNVDGGRCEKCLGEGYLTIDMQFMADVLKRCDQCDGTRFGPRVRQVRYRDRHIADVLGMTVDEAFGFFRGHRRVQTRLKFLKDAGLDYVQLGQPVSTLSVGEAQRLRLAAFLGSSSSKRTLFIMDEPTSGLHLADVVRLAESFNTLIDVGHSLIVIEHNLLMMARADHIIDLGPGPADLGGRVVAAGTPEEIRDHPGSVTGQYLQGVLSGAGMSS